MNKRKLKKLAKKKGLPMPLMTKPKFKDAGKFPYIKKLTGGQAKLDRNKNNKIDAQDFAILRKEKAKGRGKGLQDEKMKPGKVMKAALGAIALGAMTAAKLKKLKGKKNKMPGAAGVMGSGLVPGMSVADIIQKKLKRSKGGGADYNRPKSADDIIQAAVRDKGKAQGRRRPSMKGPMGRLATEKPKKGMMGGGMMMTPRGAMGAMGGGMMMKPMGYKAGKSVKVKCKIGRNKPTKMY